MKKLILLAVAILGSMSSYAQWEPDARLTNDPFLSTTTYSNSVHTLAVSGDTVHVVWYDNRDGNTEIYYKRSVDAGLTWEPDVRLTNFPGNSEYPSIAVSGSTVHVAWIDRRDADLEIYYKRSGDGGGTWGPDTRISWRQGNSWHPCMAVSSQGIMLAWYEYMSGLMDVFYVRSTDDGLTWGSETRLTSVGSASWPSLYANSPDIHAVWYDQRDGNREIYYNRSADGGLTWGSDVRLTNDPGKSWYPCIAVHGNVVHVAWADDRDGGTTAAYYKQSQDGGATWEPDMKLAKIFNGGPGPSLAVSGSAVHLVWYDDRDGNQEIYYNRSENEGLDWGTDARLTDTGGDSEYPSIAVSGTVVHVVWNDLRDGNEEIYYKRNPTGGFAVGTGNDRTNTDRRQITAYPNPASTALHIQCNADNNNSGGISGRHGTYIVRNIFGEEMLCGETGSGETVMDVSGLPCGAYFLDVDLPGKVTEKRKLVIMR